MTAYHPTMIHHSVTFEDGDAAAGQDFHVLHDLPGGGQHVGDKDEPVVRRTCGTSMARMPVAPAC